MHFGQEIDQPTRINFCQIIQGVVTLKKASNEGSSLISVGDKRSGMKLSCVNLQNVAGRLISVKVGVQLPTDSKINKLSFVLYLKHKNHF